MPRVQDSEVEMNPSSGAQITLTAQQLQEMIAAAIAAGVKEATKPTPEQIEKMEVDKRMREKAQHARVEVGKAAERERIARQANCNHKMNNGNSDKYAVGGQLHSDGKVHMLCLRCQKEVSVYTPSQQELSQIA